MKVVFLSALFATILLSSCSSDDDPKTEVENQEEVITNFTVTLVSGDKTIELEAIDADGDELFVKEILDDGLIGKIYFDRDNRLFIYTPKEGFIGSDKFVYVVTDGRGGFDTANVTINVAKEYIE